MLYFPWRNECDLIGDDNTYFSKFHDPSVKEVVQRYQAEFEPFAESVDEALEFIRNNSQFSTYGERFDPFNEQENSQDLLEFIGSNPGESSCSIEEHIEADDIIMPETQSAVPNSCMTLPVCSHTQSVEVTDDIFHATVRSLKAKQ